eukprot:CAMPEP_0178951848 /NCGR_PEP_ID=MMETSP0789-20121207/7463_1 /TAXON_ID=3005 /ORGANISM="Rhizosolenia setigera, Strain CCMP 1694" /LENGTH=643 /DNA_ID=CAMNT_0020632785 /DNA_START=1 /DNA_END=1932 /DNA_ORIENTATION=-
MRRILKRPIGARKWLRQKFEKGLFERGSNIPTAHEILSMNPPAPTVLDHNYVMKEFQDETYKKVYQPTISLMNDYIVRQDLKRMKEELRKQEDDEIMQQELRLSKILGVDRKTPLGNKAVSVGNAYKFAIRQLKIKNDNPDMTDEESILAVEELLRQEDSAERRRSRDLANKIKKEAMDKEKMEGRAAATNVSESEEMNLIPSTEGPIIEAENMDNLEGIPSMLHGESKTILELTAWGERLKEIPYNQWSIGAATSLDHWIAVKILKLSENTWKGILAGKEEVGTSRSKDIVATRKTLFPETVMSGSMMDVKDDEDPEAPPSTTSQRIDDLLATLDASSPDDQKEDSDWDSDDSDNEGTFREDYNAGRAQEYQAQLDGILEELQSWREKQSVSKYEDWDLNAKNNFQDFLSRYIELTIPEDERDEIDVDATADYLLSEPPMSREESDTFYSNFVDETEAEIFLDKLLKDPAPPASSAEIYDKFLSLPRDVQIRKLVSIGTLRPFYDEYATEKTRLKFLQDNFDTLFQGVSINSFVEDKKGSVTMEDLRRHGKIGKVWGVKESDITEGDGDEDDSDDKFSSKKREKKLFTTKKVPFGNKDADLMLDAWGEYKKMKAQYEEKLFDEGKTGLDGKSLEDDEKKEEK